MNYRHAFHAGNHADVVKHVALLACLDHLRKKSAPFAVLDTHAGAGLYDFAASAAQRSPEWRDGIAKLYDAPHLPPALARYVEAVRAHNPDGALRFYPGSPLLVADALRKTDRLAACELHPEEAAALKQRLRLRPNAQIHQRDGWEAARALLPFPERRGLVLIDPPYEAPGDLDRAVAIIRDARARMRGATILCWRPMKDERALDRADEEALAYEPPDALRVDFAVASPARQGPLAASSLLILNPPHTLAGDVIASREALLAHLTQAEGAACVVKPLPAR